MRRLQSTWRGRHTIDQKSADVVGRDKFADKNRPVFLQHIIDFLLTSLTRRSTCDAFGLTLSCQRIWFLPRDVMLARYMLSSCVCPSVRPSQAGTVPKWLNVGYSEILVENRRFETKRRPVGGDPVWISPRSLASSGVICVIQSLAILVQCGDFPPVSRYVKNGRNRWKMER